MNYSTEIGVGARAIKKALAASNIAERITQGRGYVYFTGGDSFTWFSSSIPVCYVRELSVATVIEWWKLLSAEK